MFSFQIVWQQNWNWLAAKAEFATVAKLFSLPLCTLFSELISALGGFLTEIFIIATGIWNNVMCFIVGYQIIIHSSVLWFTFGYIVMLLSVFDCDSETLIWRYSKIAHFMKTLVLYLNACYRIILSNTAVEYFCGNHDAFFFRVLLMYFCLMSFSVVKKNVYLKYKS